MKPERFASFFFFIGLLAFHLLFWKEQMGLNTLVFAGLMISALYYLNGEEEFSKGAKILACGTLLSALLVVFHNSTLSKLIHILSFTSFIGFVQQRELRFIWYAYLLGLANILETPKKLIRQFANIGNAGGNFSKGVRYFRIGILPFGVLTIFYFIYYAANPNFAQIADNFWGSFNWLWNWDISLPRVVFFLLSVFICGGILFKTGIQSFLNIENKKTEDLIRKRSPKFTAFGQNSAIALKIEYQAGLFLIFALNVLLLIVNLTDIGYVWFGFDEGSPQNLKSYVHEGTWLLIAAILLAMGVLLYFFRKNLNFYPRNNHLVLGAYIWIIQNVLLAISVGIRNYRYIDFHGLAYKRIGVIVFLILVFYGLWTMYLKVRDRKSLYFLFSKNTWALYFILLICSCINWDIAITKYNLTVPTKGAVDVQFMLKTVSDKNLYLLKEQRDQLQFLTSFPIVNEKGIDHLLLQKEMFFKLRTEKLSWPSWNLSDYRNKKYLEGE